MILLKETHLLFQPMLFYRFLYCSLPFKIVFQMPMPVYRALEVLGSVMTTATLVYLHCLTVFTTGQKPDQRLQRHFPYAAVRKPDPKTTTTDCWVNRLIFFCSCHPCNISSSGKWIPAWNFAGNIFYNTHANMHASVYMCSQACAWECAQFPHRRASNFAVKQPIRWRWSTTSSSLAIAWSLPRTVRFSPGICQWCLKQNHKSGFEKDLFGWWLFRRIFLPLKMGCVLWKVQLVGTSWTSQRDHLWISAVPFLS